MEGELSTEDGFGPFDGRNIVAFLSIRQQRVSSDFQHYAPQNEASDWPYCSTLLGNPGDAAYASNFLDGGFLDGDGTGPGDGDGTGPGPGGPGGDGPGGGGPGPGGGGPGLGRRRRLEINITNEIHRIPKFETRSVCNYRVFGRGSDGETSCVLH